MLRYVLVYQVRFHGRGGQGVVTAAELLSVDAFLEGKFAQAFPSFGPERTGAPVTAFCRIDDRVIRTHEPIAHPNVVVVVHDASLLWSVAVLEGLAPDGWVLVNTRMTPEALGLPASRTRVVAASEIARRELGKPFPNAALLGAFSALTHEVGIEAIVDAIEARFKGAARAGNVAAARAAHAEIADILDEEGEALAGELRRAELRAVYEHTTAEPSTSSTTSAAPSP